MSVIDLNNSEEYIKEIKIFNDGKSGVVENVRIRIEKKSATEDENKPNYKLIASDNSGEVNEGFYYQAEDSKGFSKYQAQRLIQLAKGVLGKDVKFPIWNTPVETLDGVMTMVAKAVNNKAFRVAVCYGTTKKPSQYLRFKSFGSFIQPMTEANVLNLSSSDNSLRATPIATPTQDLISGMTPSGNPDNLDWMNTSS